MLSVGERKLREEEEGWLGWEVCVCVGQGPIGTTVGRRSSRWGRERVKEGGKEGLAGRADAQRGKSGRASLNTIGRLSQAGCAGESDGFSAVSAWVERHKFLRFR